MEAFDMNHQVKVGIIGDHDPNLRYHIATDEALGHAAASLSISHTCSWVPTQSLEKGSIGVKLEPFHALWCAPGSPYKSMDGVLRAIQFAREHRWPFMGT